MKRIPRRMTGPSARARAAIALVLAIVFALTTGVRSAGDVALAVATGLVLAPLVPRAADGRSLLGGTRRALSMVLLVLAWLRELVRGGLAVWPVLVGARSWRRGGLVRVELDAATRQGVILSSLIATSTPGTVVIELDEEARSMLVHTIDARDPEAIRRAQRLFYARRQRPVLP